jgi:hypothetical protein
MYWDCRGGVHSRGVEFMDRIMGRDIEEKRRWEVERGEEWKSAANMKG